MTSSSSPQSEDKRPNVEVSPETYLETLQDVQQQQVELKVEVERIHQDVERFRVFFQTLVSGLLLAIAIAFGIAIWYAYRSFSEQQIARQTVDEVTAMQESLATQVDRLEGRLQRLEQDFPERVDEVNDDVQASQTALRRLRERLDAVTAQLEALNQDSDETEEETETSEETASPEATR
jgi:uncharacterized protein YoxC